MIERGPVLRSLLTLALAVSSIALAQLPDAKKLAAAKAMKPTIDSLVQRGTRLRIRLDDFEAMIKGMTGTLKDGAWVLSRPATSAELAKFDTDLKTLAAEADQLDADCEKHTKAVGDLSINGSEEYCTRYFDSMHEKTDGCAAWRGFDVLKWPAKDECDDAADLVRVRMQGYRQSRSDWEKEQKKAQQREALESVYLQPVSGSPQQRVVILPRKYVTRTSTSSTVDALGLFDAVHPSHFVFLRKNVSEAPRFAANEAPVAFARTLKKGEAVLPIECVACTDRYVNILSLDGAQGIVSAEDLAVMPLPGTKPVVLVAADLNVKDESGKVLAGPTWLVPDSTGFSLDESNGWLDLLDPPEPRQQKFIEAKNKVLECYRKKLSVLDPEARYSKYFDVVTYGRDGIAKIESAAVAFDRQACAECKCKAFNEMKRKLIKEAIAPAQKKAFEPYRALLEKLSKTDFASSAKGAPKGTATKTEAL